MAIRHGVFTRISEAPLRPITEVSSNAIFLVGTVPTYRVAAGEVTVNEPVRSIGDLNDARLAGGVKVPGFTIPQALDALRDNGAATVDFVNVFDADIHKSTATAQSYTFSNGYIQLKRTTGDATANPEGLTGDLTVTGFSEGTDYTVDRVLGKIKRLTTGTIDPAETVDVTYTFADPELVTDAQIIGGVDNGVRTGLSVAYDLYNLRGYKPKLMIVPKYNESPGVAVEMEVVAEEVKCYFFLDAPDGATRDEAIAGRSGTAPVSTFQTASRYAVLCYPYLVASDGTRQPYSQYLCGVTAGVDREFGFHYSPSNQGINGVTGVGVKLSGDFTSDNTDINALNAAGIVTVFAGAFGSGIRTWGNRSALFPSDTDAINFISVGRSLDIVIESIQRSSLPYVDKPINRALIDSIVASAQGFLLEQIQDGAVIAGSQVYLFPEENLVTQIAAGQLTVSIILMIPTPLETLIYDSTLDIRLLSNVLPDQLASA